MTNAAQEVGRIIGGIAREQSSIQENLSPDEFDSLLSTLNSEEVVSRGVLTATSRELATDSFVIDHPVYGEIDSSTLKIDGGYAANYITYTAGAFSYPGTYTSTAVQVYTVDY